MRTTFGDPEHVLQTDIQVVKEHEDFTEEELLELFVRGVVSNEDPINIAYKIREELPFLPFMYWEEIFNDYYKYDNTLKPEEEQEIFSKIVRTLRNLDEKGRNRFDDAYREANNFLEWMTSSNYDYINGFNQTGTNVCGIVFKKGVEKAKRNETIKKIVLATKGTAKTRDEIIKQIMDEMGEDLESIDFIELKFGNNDALSNKELSPYIKSLGQRIHIGNLSVIFNRNERKIITQ